MGARTQEEQTFTQYLEAIGLADKEQPEIKAVTKEEAIKKAQEILEMAKKRS